MGIPHKKKYVPVPKHAPLKILRRVYELGPQNTTVSKTLGLDELWRRSLLHQRLIGITHKENYAPVPKYAPSQFRRRIYIGHLKTHQEAKIDQWKYYWECL